MKSSIVTVATASASFVFRVVVVVLVLVRVLFFVLVLIDVFVILVFLVVVVVIVVAATAVLFVVGVFILVVVSKVFSSIDFIDVVFAHHRDVLPFRRLPPLVSSSRPFASAVLFVGIFVVLQLLFFLLLRPARGSFRRRRQSRLHLLLLLLLLLRLLFFQSARRRRKRKTTTLTSRQLLALRGKRRIGSRLFALHLCLHRRLCFLLIALCLLRLESGTIAFRLLFFVFFDLLFFLLFEHFSSSLSPRRRRHGRGFLPRLYPRLVLLLLGVVLVAFLPSFLLLAQIFLDIHPRLFVRFSPRFRRRRHRFVVVVVAVLFALLLFPNRRHRRWRRQSCSLHLFLNRQRVGRGFLLLLLLPHHHRRREDSRNRRFRVFLRLGRLFLSLEKKKTLFMSSSSVSIRGLLRSHHRRR